MSESTTNPHATHSAVSGSRVQELEHQLLAKDKTLKVLIQRAQDRQRNHTTAFGTLEQNVALEKVVKRKTEELALRNRELEKAHAALFHAQAELLEAQKLESIGRLASGVAHEINTPVQFVNDSVHFIRDGIEDLLTLQSRLEAALDSGQKTTVFTDLKSEFAEAADDADLEYLRSHLPRAVERCMEGLNRVAEIVRSMREFAHPDQKEMAALNINRSVMTTLTIASNEYKYVADITTHLGNIPNVLCHGGEINQVILNLIVNAAQAIGDIHATDGERGTIVISTRQVNDLVEIEIADSGGGIPEAVRHRVFDPFFTTKEVGKGTGQGLAIARNVVHQKHGGSISFNTTPGVGTTFLVRLPINGPHAAKEVDAA